MRTSYKIFIFCIFCFAFISCDRATKDLAKINLKDRDAITYFHNTIRLEYVENTGAFLSFGANWSNRVSFWALTVIPLLILFGLFVYVINKSRVMNLRDMIPFALIFSGGIGNIMDRIVFDRHVVDFINVGINEYRTGIFNFADVYVTTGILILVFFSLKKQEVGET
ncbi:MAG: signal peptidase II [Bacteroidetes bacterium]|nr:MAG: signal peptidase II [Bacteroidota bacterium]